MGAELAFMLNQNPLDLVSRRLPPCVGPLCCKRLLILDEQPGRPRSNANKTSSGIF